MKKVLILGGGYSGSVIADELSVLGISSIIIEKSEQIGGKVRDYGCKAEEECTNCGMCLVKDLFSRVENDKRIEIVKSSNLEDVYGSIHNFKVLIKKENKTEIIEGISDIVVSTGFKDSDKLDFYGIEVPQNGNIIRGNEMESLMKNRDTKNVFESAPKRVGFIQCYGSRDKSNSTNYCSKVCCGYSTRMARVLKKYYPEAEIDMFCMDMQEVEKGSFIDLLNKKGINLIKSRPAKITENNSKPTVRYEDSISPDSIYKTYDYLILSDGIVANPDNEHISEVLGLYLNKAGFLREVSVPDKTGVHISGCATEPMGIADTYKMSVDIARKICIEVKVEA